MSKTLLTSILVFASLIFTLSPESAYAINIHGPAPHFVVEETIDVRTPISGDAVLIGQSVVLTKPVSGDVFIIAESVVIDTPIEGDLRVIASKINLKSRVSGSFGFIGETVVITNTGEIDSDVYGVTENFNLKGRIGRNLNLLQGDDSVTVVDGRVIGNIHYSNKPPLINDSAFVGGSLSQTQPMEFKSSGRDTRLQLIIGKLIHSLSLILIAFIGWKLFHKKFIDRISYYNENILGNLVSGIAAALVIPLVLFLLFVSVIGIPLVLFISATLLFLVYISPIFLASFIGNKIFSSERIKFLHIVTGILVFNTLSLGTFVGFVLYLFSAITILGLVFKYSLKPIPRKSR